MEMPPYRSESATSSIFARSLGVIWRIAAVGIIAALAQVVGGLTVQIMRLDLPAIAVQTDPAQSLRESFLAGLLLAVVMAAVATRLPVRLVERVAVLFLTIFVLNRLLSLIEASFFTTYFARGLAGTLIVTAIAALGLATPLGLLFPPRNVEISLGAALRALAAQRPTLSWIWRIGLAGVLYVPTYFFFGSLVYPFVRSYYEDPSLGLGLRVPGAEIILPLEIARGLVFVLTLVPLVALLRGSRWAAALWLGLIIAALGAWEPLLYQQQWPVAMRLAHGLEITGDSLIQGLTIAWLVGVPRTQERPDVDGQREPVAASVSTAEKTAA